MVREAAKQLEKKETKKEIIYKALIPSEVATQFNNGDLSLMKGVDGSILPTIVNEKNQIVKTVRLEKLNIAPQDLNIVNQLGEKILNQKLDDISDQLEIIIELAKDINKSLQNKTYGQVIGAIRTIEQSYLSEGRNTRQQLQNNAQAKLNESISVLEIEMQDGIEYFRNWDKRIPFINKYSSHKIQQKFNKIMEDYVYLNSAKSAFIELKRNQGMTNTNLELLSKDLESIDKQLKDTEISSWLPPQTTENTWQHELLNRIELDSSRIVIEYNVKELLPEGSESNNE